MVTFTRTTAGSYDAATDTSTPITTTIVGNAFAVKGDWRKYRALGLIESHTITLFFTPQVYGNDPVKEGDTTQWGGRTLTVRDVTDINPDGLGIIASRVIVGA